MSESAPGITFRETMAGPFALGITDPSHVHNADQQSKNTLAMHATVVIHDMQRFVDDPSHLGSLTGDIDFPAFGTTISATSGVFNLFTPTNDPQLTHMVYELGFTHEGKSYYLAGHKDVRNDPGIDLWTDTTTLYTTLHEGSDKTAPVIGAGVLRLGMTDLLKLVSTMRVTNAHSLSDQAMTLSRFGKFFMGELWDKYGPKQATESRDRIS